MENLKRVFAGIKEDPRNFLVGFAGWFVFITLYWASINWIVENYVQNSQNPAAGMGFILCLPGPIFLSGVTIIILHIKKRPQIVRGILWAFGFNSIAAFALAWFRRDSFGEIVFEFLFWALSMIPFFAPPP